MSQGFTTPNEEETKDQILGDQKLRTRNTSGKRGSPPQLDSSSSCTYRKGPWTIVRGFFMFILASNNFI